MKYYVVSDVHGFYVLLKRRLEETGFFADPGPRKLLVAGDLFDRGDGAAELQNFILELMEKDEVVLLRGNHEDLFLRLVDEDGGMPFGYHRSNGTYSTALQLTGFTAQRARANLNAFTAACRETPYYRRIIPAGRDYLETEHYIFTHGWIPCVKIFDELRPIKEWRQAAPELWAKARWFNGMKAVLSCPADKTVVCGHWHASFGHAAYEKKGSEFGPDADFSPYIAPGIIAIDACTAYSGQMNVLVIEDEEVGGA